MVQLSFTENDTQLDPFSMAENDTQLDPFDDSQVEDGSINDHVVSQVDSTVIDPPVTLASEPLQKVKEGTALPTFPSLSSSTGAVPDRKRTLIQAVYNVKCNSVC